jgi:O-antigen ligase
MKAFIIDIKKNIPYISVILMALGAYLYAVKFPSIIPYSIFALTVVVSFVTFACTNQVQFSSRIKLSSDRVIVLLTFFAYVIAIQLIASRDVRSIITSIIALVIFFVVLFMFLLIDSRKKRSELLLYLFFLLGVVTILIITGIILFHIFSREYKLTTRVFREILYLRTSKNIYGSVLMFSMVATISLALKSTRMKWLIWLIVIVEFGLVIVLGSRTAMIGTFASVFVYLMPGIIKRFLIRISIVSVFLLMIIIMICVLIPGFVNLIDESEILNDVFTHRNSLWAASLRAMHENVFGYGIKQEISAIQSHMPNIGYIMEKDPHNTFLRYGVSIGIIGMIFYAFILVLPLLDTFNMGKKVDAFHAIFLGVFVYQLAEVLLIGGLSIKNFLFTLLYCHLLLIDHSSQFEVEDT